jgi:hypothetical protein
MVSNAPGQHPPIYYAPIQEAPKPLPANTPKKAEGNGKKKNDGPSKKNDNNNND